MLMRWSERPAWLLLPLLMMAAFAALLWVRLLTNPIIVLRADLGTLALICGGLGSASLLLARYQRRRSEQAIRIARHDAQVQHRRFLARLDHELKNPITAIRTGISNLAKPELADVHSQAIASIDTQAMRLTRLIFDLRKLADLETKDLDWGEIDVAAMLEELVQEAHERDESQGLLISLSLPQLPWPLTHIRGDHDLLHMAIYNLIDNAIKYCRPGDRIDVRGIEDGDTVVIEVADSGIGISEADLPRVWDELYRTEAARVVQGSGLGLALVAAIARRHGGSATIRSRLGKGTVVSLRVPIKPITSPGS